MSFSRLSPDSKRVWKEECVMHQNGISDIIKILIYFIEIITKRYFPPLLGVDYDIVGVPVALNVHLHGFL